MPFWVKYVPRILRIVDNIPKYSAWALSWKNQKILKNSSYIKIIWLMISIYQTFTRVNLKEYEELNFW